MAIGVHLIEKRSVGEEERVRKERHGVCGIEV